MKKIKKYWFWFAIILGVGGVIYSENKPVGAVSPTIYQFKYADEKITKKARTTYGKDFAITDNLNGTKTGEFYTGDNFYIDPVTEEVRIVKYATSTSPIIILPEGAKDLTLPISFQWLPVAFAVTFSPSQDCRYVRDPPDESWNSVITGAGTFSECTPTADNFVATVGGATTDTWAQNQRATFDYDTSSVGTGQTILTGSMRLTGRSKSDTLSATPTANLYGGNNTYAGRGNTDLGTAITYANWVGTNTITFDADGLANVNPTGTTYHTLGTNYDCTSCASPTWSNGANYVMAGAFVEDATEGERPLLTLTWAAAASAGFEDINVIND